MRHYMFMMFRSSRFLKTIILFSVFIFPLFSAIAKELVNPAGALIYHYPEDQGNYSITIQTQAPPPPVSFTQKLMQSQFRVKRIISSEEFKVSSKAKHIGDRLSQQLREQFNFSINLKTSNWLLSVKTAVAQVEPRVRAVFNNSLLMESQAEDWKSGWFSGWYPIEIKMVKEHWAPKRVEGSVQAHIIEEEAEVYKTALDIVNQVSDRSAQAVSQNTTEFKQLVSESVPFSVVDIPLKTPEWIDRKKFYEQNVTQAVREVLDLTDDSVQKLFKVGEKAGKRALTEEDIATKIKDDPKAYQLTHIIGDIAKKKSFKAIQAPSAHGGNNVIIFTELK